ncbi:hypothetical protein GCM10012289_43360 [Nonomuraea cavernae]|uniref:Uncharacterized protein n=1 Tax=Nonomuraea cavernae TaxID=2045107 RepID=A0A917Z5C6_9ACTN|nr:hypothetical protein GCM10012289_43360 [Nonomuraea cavernae]
MVIPFTVWAWRRLRAAGVPVSGGPAAGAATAAFPLVLGGVHALAHILTRRGPQARGPQARGPHARGPHARGSQARLSA